MFIWVISKNGMLASAVLNYLENNRVKYISTEKAQVDILDISQIQNFAEKKAITHIINCSAYTDVEKAEVEKKLCFLLNVKGVENLAIVAKNMNVKLIHYSTDYVFDGKRDLPYLETDRRYPLNYYGHTKCLAEDIIGNMLSNYLIIRTSWLFGYNKINFPSKMVALMQTNSVIDVICNQFGRATFCEDLAEATFSVLDQNGILHFANEKILSWYDFALTIFKDLKDKGLKLKCSQINPVKTTHFKTIAKRPKYSALSTAKYESLNKVKIRSFEDCLKQYLTKEYGIY